jgi:hypothetical protein
MISGTDRRDGNRDQGEAPGIPARRTAQFARCLHHRGCQRKPATTRQVMIFQSARSRSKASVRALYPLGRSPLLSCPHRMSAQLPHRQCWTVVMGLAAVAISPMIAPLIGAVHRRRTSHSNTCHHGANNHGHSHRGCLLAQFLLSPMHFRFIAQRPTHIRAVPHDEMHASPNNNLDFSTLGLFVRCSFGCAWTTRLNGRAISR